MLHYGLADLQKLYDSKIVGTSGLGVPAEIIELSEGYLAARAHLDTYMRAGGFVPGPVQFTLTDGLAWLLVVAHLSPKSDTMTTDLSAQFMRAAPLGEVSIRLWLRQLGSRRAVVAADLFSPSVPQGPISQFIAGFMPMPASSGRPGGKTGTAPGPH
jgi:acyl-coenzyme A thioesterase PaaI-like protein